MDDIRMRGNLATLIAPLLATRPLTVMLSLDARTSAWVSMRAGGLKIGEALVGPQSVQATFEVPARALFRGDNEVELRCDKGAIAEPRLLRIELSQSAHSR